MTRSLCCLLLLLLPLIAASQPAEAKVLSQQEVQQLCDSLERELSTISSLRADFVQTKRLAIFDDEITSRGAYYYLTPDHVRMDMTSPFRSVLIARKRNIAKYELIGEDWRKLDLATSDIILMVTDQIADWMRGRLCSRPEFYDVSARRGGQTIVTLTPKHEEFQRMISAIELELNESEDRLNSVTIREPSGDFTRLDFENVEINAAIPETIFDTSGKKPQPLPEPVNTPENE